MPQGLFRQSQLRQYSALATAALATGSQALKADIVYTDVDPDVTLIDALFPIDLNDDGIVDFRIRHNRFAFGGYVSNYAGVYGNYAASFGIAAVPGIGYLASALNYGQEIGPGIPFNVNNYGILASIFASPYYGGFGVGEWDDVTDRYLGVWFTVGGNRHYGWIHMDAGPDCSELVIKGFAYEDIPDTPIDAGDQTTFLSAGAVSGLLTADVGDNGNGTDLQLRFNRVADESLVSAYRAIAVRASVAEGFNLAAANALASDRYVSVAPDGTDPVLTFSAASRDAGGSLIAPGIEYRCFVLSVADGTVALLNSLSAPSAPITLLANASPSGNVLAQDVGNNGNGSDLRVRFDPAADEGTVGEYRVLVVDSVDVPSFDLVAASAVPAGSYTVAFPTGGVNSVLLTATSRTVRAEFIEADRPYQVFVLSVADGSAAQVNGLSEPSNPITLRLISGLNAPDNQDFQAWVNGDLLMVNNSRQEAEGELVLVNLEGRAVRRWAYAGQTASFSGLANLAPGRYTLVWNGQSGQQVRNLMLAR
jgi:hypothetical protein